MHVNDKFLTHGFVETQVEKRRAHRGIERVGNTTRVGPAFQPAVPMVSEDLKILRPGALLIIGSPVVNLPTQASLPRPGESFIDCSGPADSEDLSPHRAANFNRRD